MSDFQGWLFLILAIWNFSYLFKTDIESNKYNRKPMSFFIGCLCLSMSVAFFLQYGIFKI